MHWYLFVLLLLLHLSISWLLLLSTVFELSLNVFELTSIVFQGTLTVFKLLFLVVLPVSCQLTLLLLTSRLMVERALSIVLILSSNVFGLSGCDFALIMSTPLL